MTTNTLGGKGWLGQAKMRSKHNSKCLDSLSGNCQTPGYDVFLLGVSCPVCVLVWWRLCGVLLVCVLHCCFFPSHHSRTGRPCHLAAVPTARTPGRFRYIQSTPVSLRILTAPHPAFCPVHLGVLSRNGLSDPLTFSFKLYVVSTSLFSPEDLCFHLCSLICRQQKLSKSSRAKGQVTKWSGKHKSGHP